MADVTELGVPNEQMIGELTDELVNHSERLIAGKPRVVVIAALADELGVTIDCLGEDAEQRETLLAYAWDRMRSQVNGVWVKVKPRENIVVPLTKPDKEEDE